MLKTYEVLDPSVRREAPVTPSILKTILRKAKSARDIFIAHLIISAYFFAMRSCKYVATPREARTKILTTNRIIFYCKASNIINEVHHSVSTANAMQIIFSIQKNLEVEEPISNQSTPLYICLVKAWRYILKTLES